ncbi:MAG TPA: mucin-2 protein [Nocardioides sp.]|nr:mucin-2 protein [Nocardioides sp.]
MATSHKRETARRAPRVALLAGSLAALATGAVVTAGVVSSSGPGEEIVAVDRTAAAGSIAEGARERVLSRGAIRTELDTTKPSPLEKVLAPKAVAKAIAGAKTKRWTTAPLNLWDRPDQKARKVGELDESKRVLVTGRQFKDRAEVVVDGKARWVTAGYFTDEKPAPAPAGLSMAPCPDPSVENGLTDGAVYVYRSVCHAFPQITTYGGWDAHGEHSSGKALDIMNSDVGLGNAIAEFLRAHAAELNLYDVIWRQHIWTPERAGEGWRSMPSRGSATANHYDHVHVSVN